jgi:hypothetical protein
VLVRIGLARTTEISTRIGVEAVLARIEACVLAREDQARRNAARGQRVGEGRQFDRFRPGADDQPYVRGTQPSP